MVNESDCYVRLTVVKQGFTIHGVSVVLNFEEGTAAGMLPMPDGKVSCIYKANVNQYNNISHVPCTRILE